MPRTPIDRLQLHRSLPPPSPPPLARAGSLASLARPPAAMSDAEIQRCVGLLQARGRSTLAAAIDWRRPQQLPSHRRWFHAIDADRTGTITAQELQRALGLGGLQFSLQACAQVRRASPADDNAMAACLACRAR